MRTQARVGAARLVAAERAANIADIHPGRQALNDLVAFGDDGLFYP
jgi:hypothetical protein